MRPLVALLIGLTLCARGAGGQVVDTEIFLAPLRVVDGRVSIGTLRNITNRAGYDNQPFFTRDGAAILYTARIDDAQTDIFRYDLRTERTTRLTSTPESEYSPTPLPTSGFSVIRVEADSAQRLWRFQEDGQDPRVLLPQTRPVGYQAWIDSNTAAIFVLGRPATLRTGNVETGRVDSIAAGIGRAIQKIPDAPAVSFVQISNDTVRMLYRLHGPTRQVERIVRLPAGGEYHGWLPNGVLLATTGTRLLEWRAGGDWRVVADFSAEGRQLSRIAVSPRGDWIALVGQRAPQQ